MTAGDVLKIQGVALLLLAGCTKKPQDEARLAGLSPADFPQITADVFQPMDGGVALTQEEIMGRNAWNLWTAGNEHFWNNVAQDSYGLMDLLKSMDNRKVSARRTVRDDGCGESAGFPRAGEAG